jgi:hypothetical protein
VTRLTTESADSTTLVLCSLGDLAIFNLFPEPAVTPGYFVFGSVLGLSSLVDPADPLSGSVSTLIFRTLDAVLLGKLLNSGVGFFDFRAATTVVSVLTTVLTLITTHNSLSSIHIIARIWSLSSFYLRYLFHVTNIIYKFWRAIKRLALVEDMIFCSFVVPVKLAAWGQTDNEGNFIYRGSGRGLDQHTGLNLTAFLD